MKCPKCGGYGDIPRPNGTKLFGLTEVMTCDLCKGVGVVELTNDEWRRTCSTEEFAEFLFIIGEDNWLTDISNRDEVVPHEKDVVEWLKEIHQ